LPKPEGTETRNAFSTKGKTNCDAFREVLNANPYGQSHRSAQCGTIYTRCISAKCHPYGESFRNVVEGNGEHEKRRRLPIRFDSFRFVFIEIDVEVRNEFVQAEEKECSSPKSDGRREPGYITEVFGELNGRSQKAPIGGGNHDATGEAQHAIQGLARHFLKEEY